MVKLAYGSEGERARLIGGLAGSDYRTALRFLRGEKVKGVVLNARLEEAKRRAEGMIAAVQSPQGSAA